MDTPTRDRNPLSEVIRTTLGQRAGRLPEADATAEATAVTWRLVAAQLTPVIGARGLDVTHVNLNDGTIEGLRHRELPIVGLQYHPEAAPGPHDANVLFNGFIDAMEKVASVR